ncbi:hypothetical protein BU23DRAFT_558369 [Bimuria novae-zelandiae CBS 107.79]|uniref:Transcriptional regulatory protein RXT2 N-terminal domain-containing protein n=1 Tax=Bimuria novae-zelandiae CBS 107.79 TaxID=1447943 RepID=A0A6A5V5P1_9PLEO|nr:hypothetical protein BU23DRAFT_558369 [Bimuria novae-zelandiae CBS 107.79]
MAGSQQQQIIDTIFSIKRRILRPDESSDEDGTIPSYGNQKQSLKRKVQYSRSGDADLAADHRPYKKRIEHAGYRRYILQRNPPKYDPDGDMVEVGDEDEEDDDLSTVEENPYADIRLEELLAPLTSAADLPTHPSYSVAYTSKHLTNLSTEAAAISRKENTALRHAKILFNKLQGDPSFVPEALAPLGRETFHDFGRELTNGRVTNGYPEQSRKAADESAKQEALAAGGDVQMEDTGPNSEAHPKPELNGTSHTETQNGAEHTNGTNGVSHAAEGEAAQTNGDQAQVDGADDASDTASQNTSHRMTTRARAHAALTPSPPLSPSSTVHQIHPMFLYPTDALPDRDMGLPPDEAEDTRLLLLAYVQKQEEVARLATELFTGIMEGERMRQEVLKMAKAEAHLGEMSDGEDWYDREEWNLEEDLGKGKDEEDDDAVVTGKKSTRQRRKPDKEDR